MAPRGDRRGPRRAAASAPARSTSRPASSASCSFLIAEAILISIGLATRRTVVIVRGSLEELEPGPDAPRFPRSHVVFPFLMGRRKGVRVDQATSSSRGSAGRCCASTSRCRRRRSRPVGPATRPRPDPRRWLGDRRQAGAGHPTAHPHGRPTGGSGFNVNYRLSPAATFPDHLVDCKRAVAWIREHADEYGIDPDFICVTGGSAGGHLTALMGTTVGDPRFQPGFEGADTSVRGRRAVLRRSTTSPRRGAFGADPEIYRRFLEPMVMKAFVAEEPERFAEASPLHHVHADAPPFFVIHGDRDTLAPVEDARVFVERLRARVEASQCSTPRCRAPSTRSRCSPPCARRR